MKELQDLVHEVLMTRLPDDIVAVVILHKRGTSGVTTVSNTEHWAEHRLCAAVLNGEPRGDRREIVQ